MRRLPVPPIHDIARLSFESDGSTIAELREYYQSGGSFNYNPARYVCRKMVSGSLPLNAAVQGCLARGNPSGRKQNAEVVALAWEWSKDRDLRCYDIAPRPLVIRSDLSVPVKLDFYFVEKGRVRLFWLQPRKRYSLNEQQLGLLATCIKMLFAVDDFEMADLEILDLSAPVDSKDRALRTYCFADLPILPYEELTELLSRFASAF